jgi:plastocyanin domain-containing protein
MVNKTAILGSIASLGLVFGLVSTEAVAQMSHEMNSEQTGQFRRIEQPLENRVIVTLGGLGLIGLELWWFLFSKPKSRQANTQGEIQEITITVDGGYDPSQIVVRAGQPVKLNFYRKDANSCPISTLPENCPSIELLPSSSLPINQVLILSPAA